MLDVLRNGRQRLFRLNNEALGYLKNQLHWSRAVWYRLQGWVAEESLDEATFLKRFWAYYDQLLAYRQNPSPPEHARLLAEFDTLFGQHTGYAALDQRIAKTNVKKDTLLLVLQHPELPLHNNAAELAVRQRVRKRDVSFGPRTQAGVRAWDSFATLAATTKKLGVSFYHDIQDRISATNQIPPLADLVTKAAKELNLGWSFSPVGCYRDLLR